MIILMSYSLLLELEPNLPHLHQRENRDIPIVAVDLGRKRNLLKTIQKPRASVRCHVLCQERVPHGNINRLGHLQLRDCKLLPERRAWAAWINLYTYLTYISEWGIFRKCKPTIRTRSQLLRGRSNHNKIKQVSKVSIVKL